MMSVYDQCRGQTRQLSANLPTSTVPTSSSPPPPTVHLFVRHDALNTLNNTFLCVVVK